MNKKAAIYTRVSTAEQNENGFSIHQQKDRLIQHCNLNDWKIHNIYEDGGWSGTNTDRPALQELLDDCKYGHFDVVLVYKLDRLSRSVPQTYELFDYFEKHNVTFQSATEGFDTSTAYGQTMSGFLSIMAQMENSVRVERIAEGKIGKAKRGEPMSGHNPPFGYNYDKKNKRYIINEEQAAVVKEIYSLYLSGIGATEIVAELNSRGYVGKTVPWTRNHVRNVLKNVIYTGKQKYKGTVYEANHEPIIDEDIYNETQKQREIREINAYKENNPRPWQSKYILSGLLRCEKCGGRMEMKTQRWRNKDGTRHNKDKYRCVNGYHTPRQKKDPSRIQCSKRKYSREDLEEMVLKKVSELTLSDVRPKEKTAEKDYSGELNGIERKLGKLKHLYMEDLISFDEMKKDTDKLKDRKKSIHKETAENKVDKKDDTEIKELIRNGINFSGMSITETKITLNTLIDYIGINEDDVTIFWHF